MEIIAHRSGNSIAALAEAELAGVDAVEVDVHLTGGGRLEVRHGKRLWPTRRLWEKWYLLPRDTDVPDLEQILQAAGSETSLWLDLKGPDPRLANAVRGLIGERAPLTISSKAWWNLHQFREIAGVRTIRSAGNRFELALLLWLPTRAKIDGAVVHRRLLNEALARRLLRRGLLFSWAVPDAATVQSLVEMGLTGVILDDLGFMPAR